MTEVPAPFGKYYLTEKLAAGGMAEIYLAKLLGPGGFEKLLVLKQIHPKLSGQRHFVDLFVAEAKILVGLLHGNIVPVYELGVLGDTYYIAMEYIDGPSLYRFTEQVRAKGEIMEPAVAAHIATKILDGLDYAHRKGEGIIHRDLSGRNVMLSRDGEVKLVDFGIAVALGDPGDVAGDTPAGSFPYMSPEQVRREPLTGQSDLFSVGILMWEMLAGERLFARPDAAATLRAVTEAELAPPSSINPAVPGRLDEVVMKALERDRSKRWKSAAEMLAALHRYLYSLEETPGARELGRLVATYCPPTARRRPTEGEASPASLALAGTAVAAGQGGPSTAVIPRVRQQSFATHVELAGLLRAEDSALDAGGPPSAPPELTNAGEPVTAVVVRDDVVRDDAARDDATGDDAAGDREAPSTASPSASPPPAPPSSARTDAADGAASMPPPSASAPPHDAASAGAAALEPRYPRADGVEAEAAIARSASHLARPRASRRRVAVFAAALSLAAAGAVAATALRGEDRGRPAVLGSGEAATPPPFVVEVAHASSGAPLDAGLASPLPSAFDAGLAPRASADARAPDAPRPATPADARRPELRRLDARPPTPVDARWTPAPADARPDAKLLPRPDAPQPQPQPQPKGEPALVKVGANPWGEIFLDGKPAGRTPRTLSVSPGHHEIEVAFPVVTPPRREIYRLDLSAGETRSVLADFTH